MKKVFKYLVLVLTLLTLYSVPVFATGTPVENITGNDADTGKVSQQDGVIEGASSRRTGYLIWASDETGAPYNGEVVFVPTRGAESLTHRSTTQMTTSLVNRMGFKYTNVKMDAPIPWSKSPFDYGVREEIREFIKSPYDGYDNGGLWILEKYLGMTSEQAESFVALGEDAHLNIESVMMAGIYDGMTFSGKGLLSTVIGWANCTQSNNYLSSYTHEFLCNTIAFDKEWLRISVPSDITSKHTSAEILAQPYTGWGICSFRLQPGDKERVRVYMTDGVVDKTVYDTTSSPVTVDNEGEYTLVEWDTSKTKTSASSPTATYDEVIAGCTLVQSGSGVSTVTMPAEEKAIFILYERTAPTTIIVRNEDSIRAHELNFPFAKMNGKRVDDGWMPTEFDFNSKYTDEQSSQNSKDDVQNWQASKTTFTVEETFSGAVNTINASGLHLYHTGIGKYAPYAESKVDRFSLTETIIPHYSYNVTRAIWEPELMLSSYRPENASVQGYVNDVLKIPSANIGSLTSADPGSNVETTLDPREDNYNFKASVDVEYEKGSKTGITGSDGNTYDSSDDLPEGVSKSGDVYGDWTSQTGTFSVDIVTYHITHYCDKFKVMSTPTASSSGVGQVADSSDGNSLVGQVRNKEAVVTQISPTLTVYPEIKMYTWVDEVDNYDAPATPTEAYVMGEYGRKFVPPMIHGFYTTTTRGGRISGATSLATPATGTQAYEVLDHYMNNGRNVVGVTNMGATFETATKDKIQMVISTVAVDFTDVDGTKSAWGNSSYNPETSHNAYVGQLKSNTEQEIVMMYHDPNGNPVGDPMYLPITSSDMAVSSTEVKEIPLNFFVGAIQTQGEILEGLTRAFNLDSSQVYGVWDIANIFDQMFISCTDPDSQNSSGNDLSHGVYGRTKWYDEESVGTLVVKVYTTTITYGNMIGDDKIDFNKLQQDAASRYLDRNPDNSLEARFYARLYFKNPTISIDGSMFNEVPNAYVNEIQGCNFAVRNATTHENRK